MTWRRRSASPLLSALPSYRDRGRPFGAFVFAIAAHKVADAADEADRS
jgi:RNA polymerase sigma-70 factor, ECF subfamily